MFTLEDCNRKTVRELQQLLRENGLKVTGVKLDLCSRLIEFYQKKGGAPAPAVPTRVPSPPRAPSHVVPPRSPPKAPAPAVPKRLPPFPMLPPRTGAPVVPPRIPMRAPSPPRIPPQAPAPTLAPIPRPLSPPRAPQPKVGPKTTIQQEIERCNAMSMAQIRDELRKYNLSLGGSKAEACQRLAEYLTIGVARKLQGPLKPEEAIPVGPQAGLLKPKMFTLAECQNWTVVQLQNRLRELGLKVSGTKQILCDRLADYEKAQLPPTKKLHNIVFMEPMMATLEDIRRMRPIGINDRMYNFILQGPVPYTQAKGRPCVGNAFVFGPLLDINAYTEIAEHGNDAGSTGFIDYDLARQAKEEISDAEWKTLYNDFKTGWDDRRALEKLRQRHPEILWIGETVGGDVGARLYAHYDKNGEIDSLIVENNCLIEEEED